MKTTKIEWTETTWNPVTGCTKVSSGCKNCYAEVMAKRLCAMGVKKYVNGFKVCIHEDVLNEPLNWKKPHTIFVNSMSDLFHESVSFEFIDKVMLTIECTPHHQYQILTKRVERMLNYFENRSIPSNVWLGASIENKDVKYRIDFLRQIKAPVLFLSCEPLLGDLEYLNLKNIDWVIVGGESGVKARPMKIEWVINIHEQCKKQDVAFFFKQWGTWGADGKRRNKVENGSLLLGRNYKEYPKEEPQESSEILC